MFELTLLSVLWVTSLHWYMNISLWLIKPSFWDTKWNRSSGDLVVSVKTRNLLFVVRWSRCYLSDVFSCSVGKGDSGCQFYISCHHYLTLTGLLCSLFYHGKARYGWLHKHSDELSSLNACCSAAQILRSDPISGRWRWSQLFGKRSIKISRSNWEESIRHCNLL